jgi:hypothetical protein
VTVVLHVLICCNLSQETLVVHGTPSNLLHDGGDIRFTDGALRLMVNFVLANGARVGGISRTVKDVEWVSFRSDSSVNDLRIGEDPLLLMELLVLLDNVAYLGNGIAQRVYSGIGSSASLVIIIDLEEARFSAFDFLSLDQRNFNALRLDLLVSQWLQVQVHISAGDSEVVQKASPRHEKTLSQELLVDVKATDELHFDQRRGGLESLFLLETNSHQPLVASVVSALEALDNNFEAGLFQGHHKSGPF